MDKQDLVAMYPYLRSVAGMDTKQFNRTVTSNIKAVLRHLWPSVKFTVCYNKPDWLYSVNWEDGPTEEAVRSATNVFYVTNELGVTEFHRMFGCTIRQVYVGRAISENAYSVIENELRAQFSELKGIRYSELFTPTLNLLVYVYGDKASLFKGKQSSIRFLLDKIAYSRDMTAFIPAALSCNEYENRINEDKEYAGNIRLYFAPGQFLDAKYGDARVVQDLFTGSESIETEMLENNCTCRLYKKGDANSIPLDEVILALAKAGIRFNIVRYWN